MAESSNFNPDTELTMCDVLQEQQEIEDDANAVLGGSDDTTCSYDKGYVPRQALYACKDCPVNGEAGVCLACCYACHDGHEVVELYTKRNFRCDCGNSKFNERKCSLRSHKDPVNSDNKYNHNFKGLYCSCSRPYPDLEDEIPDEMIQCVFCEDWYHSRHLGGRVPEDYYEMICQQCMQSHQFLYPYFNKYNAIVDVDDTLKDSPLRKSPRKTKSSSLVDKEAEIKPESTTSCEIKLESTVQGNGVAIEKNNDISIKAENPNGDQIENLSQNNNKREVQAPLATEPGSAIKIENHHKDEPKENGDTNVPACLLETLNKHQEVQQPPRGSAFWPENWRQELCRCAKCMQMYCDSNCEFLLDISDTIQAYEEKGKNQSGSQYEKGLNALSQLDRVKQMEAVRGYTNMKDELKEYLKEFADSNRTVCESDIKEFFERMRKKQKLNDGVPHYCR